MHEGTQQLHLYSLILALQLTKELVFTMITITNTTFQNMFLCKYDLYINIVQSDS